MSGEQQIPRSGADVTAITRARGEGGPELEDDSLRAFFEQWLDTFVFDARLDGRLRELAILRTMWRTAQSLEWANHYRLARSIGVTRDEIVAIRTASPETDLEGDLLLIAQVVDEFVDQRALAPATLAAVEARFPDIASRYELLYLVPGYLMFAAVTNSTGLTAEAKGLPVWPPDGVAPPA
ncbi:MAG: carboxymuconolactone decarboxylase family protein [Acidimicrobiia bacterium]